MLAAKCMCSKKMALKRKLQWKIDWERVKYSRKSWVVKDKEAHLHISKSGKLYTNWQTPAHPYTNTKHNPLGCVLQCSTYEAFHVYNTRWVFMFPLWTNVHMGNIIGEWVYIHTTCTEGRDGSVPKWKSLNIFTHREISYFVYTNMLKRIGKLSFFA